MQDQENVNRRCCVACDNGGALPGAERGNVKIFSLNDMRELQSRLGQEGIGFTWVTDYRAMARSEYTEALQKWAIKSGFGDLWTGWAAEADFGTEGLLYRPLNAALHNFEPVEKLHVHFNHVHGSEIPQAVVDQARAVGLGATWVGDGTHWRKGEPNASPHSRKFRDLGMCVVLHPEPQA